MALCPRPGNWCRALLGAALVLVALAALPSIAAAQQDTLIPQSLVAPPSQVKPPPGFAISARQARAIAERVPSVRDERAAHPDLRPSVGIPGEASEATFEVEFSTPGMESQYGSEIRVDVLINGVTGEVTKVWTGSQAATPLDRKSTRLNSSHQI